MSIEDQKSQDLLFQQQQAEIQAAHDKQVASDQMAWAKQQADNAAAQQKKADDQKYYDENLSPQAQAKQAEAQRESDAAFKSDMQLAGGFMVDAALLGSKGGLTTMGPGMGLPVIGGLLAMMGFSNPQPQPNQNGPTPPQNNNNNNFTINV